MILFSSACGAWELPVAAQPRYIFFIIGYLYFFLQILKYGARPVDQIDLIIHCKHF